MRNLLNHIWARMCMKISLEFILVLAKAKINWLLKPVVHVYITGSKYQREHDDLLRSLSRIYIAYDGCMEMGRESQETMSHRGWEWTLLWITGSVHPEVMRQMCEDHPEKFPVECLLLKYQMFKWKVKNHFKQKWYWYVIYSQILVIGNL